MNECEIENMEAQEESQKEALRAFLRREQGDTIPKRAWRWVTDRWLWLKWFSWQ